jgi:CDP-paratose 2-epimerase
MRLLITGGCGFLGSNLAADAISRGDELLLFDNLYREGSLKNLVWLRSLGTFEFEHGDIRNENDIARVVRSFRPDAVFHLAGQVAMTTSIENPRLDYEVNVGGTLNLLEAVRYHAPEAIVIYSSTNKVYGDLEQFTYTESASRYECVEHPNGFDEFVQLDFHSPYGCSKGSADQYILDYSRIYGLRTVVFRHSSMYGGRQFATFDQGWVGWFCQKAIEVSLRKVMDPFSISGSGKQVRDVLHSDDMRRLYLAGIEHIDDVKGQAFNVGGGYENSLSLLELFRILEDTLDVKLQFRPVPVRESDQRVFISDLTKVKKALGWHPQVSAKQGIARMVDWLASER